MIKSIRNQICTEFNVTEQDLMSKFGSENSRHARYCFFTILYRRFNYTCKFIGEHAFETTVFDKSLVSKGIKRSNELHQFYEDYRIKYTNIEKQLSIIRKEKMLNNEK